MASFISRFAFPKPLYSILAFLLFGLSCWMPSSTAIAQGISVSEAVEYCGRAESMQLCPNICRQACRDDAFSSANEVECTKIYNIEPSVVDDPGCLDRATCVGEDCEDAEVEVEEVAEVDIDATSAAIDGVVALDCPQYDAVAREYSAQDNLDNIRPQSEINLPDGSPSFEELVSSFDQAFVYCQDRDRNIFWQDRLTESTDLLSEDTLAFEIQEQTENLLNSIDAQPIVLAGPDGDPCTQYVRGFEGDTDLMDFKNDAEQVINQFESYAICLPWYRQQAICRHGVTVVEDEDSSLETSPALVDLQIPYSPQDRDAVEELEEPEATADTETEDLEAIVIEQFRGGNNHQGRELTALVRYLAQSQINLARLAGRIELTESAIADLRLNRMFYDCRP